MKSPEKIRSAFTKALNSGTVLQLPGAYNAMVAMLIEQHGFDGVYCSGAVISNSLGLPDIGLTTLTEVSLFAQQVIERTNLPIIVDADTGFGDVMNVARTVAELEHNGVTAIHIEDQISPKRCGHLDGKELISTQHMTHKIKAAVDAKIDSNFLIIARTDAKSVEGIDAAIERAKAYIDVGADAIFPEALHNEKEMEIFRKAINVPLLSNMTEFGKTEILNINQIQNLGYNMVIYPVTMQRLAMMAVENGLESIKKNGSQKEVLSSMQTRKRLYEILEYEKYNDIDKGIYNFKI
jgi:methylisocitrate lyase|tara:strand:+ start:790 stop:1671 length:882 start_codon:yes stop_codon:yes gene_type:complete